MIFIDMYNFMNHKNIKLHIYKHIFCWQKN